MLVDHELIFDMGKDVSTAGDSTKTIDLGQVAPTPGMSKVLTVAVTVAEDVTGTLKVDLKDSDAAEGTFEVCASAAVADPVEGAVLQFPVPYRTKQFLKVSYSGATAGKVNAFLTWGRQQWEAPAQAETVQAANEDIHH